MFQNGQMPLLPEEDVGVEAFTLPCCRAVEALPGQQDFREEAEECVVESFRLHAAAVHQRVHDSAQENTVN